MHVSVSEIDDRREWRRFHDLAQHLHRSAPGWAPPSISLEKARLDPGLNPTFFSTGSAVGFLARDRGRPAGRITAQVPAPGSVQGWFGFIEAADDPDVVTPLVEAAAGWLAGQGCTEMSGPFSLTPGDEWGLRVGGHELGPITMLAWHPPRYAALLQGAEMVPGERRRWVVRSCAPSDAAERAEWSDTSRPPASLDAAGPSWLGAFRDPRLVIEGASGPVFAVPDVVGGLTEVGVRGAWSAAKRARRGEWGRCVITADVDPEALEWLVTAAGRAGYREIVVPVAGRPDGPVIEMETFTLPL